MLRSTSSLDVIALSAAYPIDPALAVAGSRAGGIGIVDLSFADPDEARQAVATLARSAGRRWGFRLAGGDARSPGEILPDWATPTHLILSASCATDLPGWIAAWRAAGRSDMHILLEVTSAAQAAIAASLPADGIIAKGNEAGGAVGEETTFVLLQRLLGMVSVPVWAQGGIGEHTAGACLAAGAAGVVLDCQLLLSQESRLPEPLRAAVSRMDGSETVVLGTELGAATRMHERPKLAVLRELRAVALASEGRADAAEHWRGVVRAAVRAADPSERIWLLGQDAAFARDLATRYGSVAGILDALRHAASRHLETARRLAPLAESAPLARTHGTRFPIVQGPMTRVSDQPAFAAAVAEAGALPFLALALMAQDQVATLLRETAGALGSRPWGVGILGFVPRDVRQRQLAAIKAAPPRFALIAGGRPEQAAELEAAGIATYLHVPSPGLLRLFIDSGARRFVFEGRECGGHVGPRSSFVLWNQMVDVLLAALPKEELAHCEILFAGGIHDAASAAMVAATAAPVAARGARIGVLIGTAYLFTDEAVQTGAVLEDFRQEAIRCQHTVLLESSPGHTTRCAATGFADEFQCTRRELSEQGASADTIRETLERLNLGRLRLAAKGLMRAEPDPSGSSPRLVAAGEEQRRTEGLFMLGQVAALHAEPFTVGQLHHEVCVAGTQRLAKPARPRRRIEAAEPAPRPADIAIIGMSCMLPGAENLETYWSNILGKVDAITEIPGERWDWRTYFDPDRSAPDRIYSKWGGFLADTPFDPMRYGIPPSTLPSIEPLQLLTLEAVRALLDDAGYLEHPFDRARASVVLGVGGGTGDLGQHYALRAAIPEFLDGLPTEAMARLPVWTEDSFPGILLNVAAGRVANRFDLHGVNFTVDAACASSLAAAYLGVNELVQGTSDLVVAGGVDTVQNPFGYLCFSKTQALSPRGRCRAFDADADGIVISEGLAFVLLKRLADAQRDGDRIYAVIKGIAGSSDGRDRSLTAPRPEGQALALRRAYAQAGFGAEALGLVEAHGTGTIAGDKAELETLRTLFDAAGAEARSCAIGSVKSMIGHTKCAAGLAGMIKTALALRHKVLPPTMHVNQPNPAVRDPGSPLYVNTEARPWLAREGAPRRAGVSSFGFGGTNFTAVLEEYRDTSRASEVAGTHNWPCELLLFRAEPGRELAHDFDQLDRAIAAGASPRLRDLAYTLWCAARDRSGPTVAIVAESLDDLRGKLACLRSGNDLGAGPMNESPGIYPSSATQGRVAFLFPGQGSQYTGMLGELAMQFDEVRSSFERADAVLGGGLGRVVFPSPCVDDAEREAQRRALVRTEMAQPALGAAAMGLVHLLARFGIVPEMAAGHSYGECSALCCAGVFDEASLYRLSEARGRAIVASLGEDNGTMAAVLADRATVEGLLADLDGVWLANMNAPGQQVISGTTAGVEEALRRMQAKGIAAKPLSVACAFHSPLISAARDRFADALQGQPIAPPQIPVYSNGEAEPYPQDPAHIAARLCEHLVNPVRFQDQIEAMLRDGARIFVEVGPKNVLSGLVSNILGERAHATVPLDLQGRNGLVQLQHGLARLAAHGVRVSLDRLFDGRNCAQLDLATLVEDTSVRPLPATTWMVNGGRSRPLRAPSPWPERMAVAKAASAVHAPNMPAKGDLMTANDAEPPYAGTGSPAFAEASPESSPNLTFAEPGMLLRPDETTQVLTQFQYVMQRFLETQQRVMLTYLTGTLAASDAGPAMAGLPAIAPAVPWQGLEAIRPAPRRTPAAPDGTRATEPPGRATETPRPAPAHRREAAPVDVTQTLLRIVSDRTGYPVEMLGLDLNIEADLGIDSIKRVEIMAGLQRAVMGEGGASGGDIAEGLAEIKTLRGMADAVAGLLEGRALPFARGPMAASPSTGTLPTGLNAGHHSAFWDGLAAD